MIAQDQEREDTTLYKVVVNHEEQYSIWPADWENPMGWRDAGKRGLKADCLAHIKEVWTDMRPLSLRAQMEEAARRHETERLSELAMERPDDIGVVDFLTEGSHPVDVVLRPEKTVAAFRERLDNGFLHVKFIDTKGGTELMVRLDPGTDRTQADFDNQSGGVHVEGSLTLDYVKVRCFANITLPSLAGTGYLRRVE